MRLTPTLALALATTAAAGCSFNKPSELRPSQFVSPVGGEVKVIQPKRCQLTVAILDRPLRDPLINSALWSTADEQTIAPEARRAIQDNGLRLGVITGDLPPEVDALLKAPPPRKVEPAKYFLPEGQHTLLSVAAPVPQLSMLLNDDGRAHGKDFQDASGFLRMTAGFEGSNGVGLRFVPEIHHGPVLNSFGAAASVGGISAPQQFTVKNSQQEDTLRQLAASVTLQPNQIAVVGCDPDRPRSLGACLLTQPEQNSDRLMQKVVLVWAVRVRPGDGADLPSLTPAEPPK